MPRVPRRSNYARLLLVLPFLLLLTSVPAGKNSLWSVLRPTASAATTSTVYSTAQTFEVNSTADATDGSCTAIGVGNGCTLREAITGANSLAGADVITFASALTSGGPATITLLSALPNLASEITITGPGSSLLTVQRSTAGGTPSFRIFTIDFSTVSISGLTLTNGRTADGVAGTTGTKSDDGGGIRNTGNLTLTDVSVIANRTGDGGAGLAGGGNAGWGGGIANSGTLTMTNCTVSENNGGRGGDGNSFAGDGGYGGGLYNESTLTMTNCIVNGNNGGHGGDGGNGGGHGGNGGGIHAHLGTITLTTVTISNNVAGDNGDNGSGGFAGHGGGINLSGTNAVVTMINCAVTGNRSGSSVVGTDGFGGGIMDPGVMFITGSTISGNISDGPGGGIMVQGAGFLRLSNSTASGNQAQQGGGIFNDSSTILNMTNTTVTANSAPGNNGNGIYTYNAAKVRNSIIAGNGAPGAPDLNGPCNSQGHNLIGNADGATGFTATGDQAGTTAAPIPARLASLANYGGPTQTHALLPGSSAIDAGDNCVTEAAHCGDSNVPTLTTDQRGPGFNRFVNNTVDIGAFESRGFTIVATSGTPQSAPINTTFGAPLVATISSAFSEPIEGGVLSFAAPLSGPSGSFSGGGQVAQLTIGGSGVVTSPAFSANNQAGSYNVIAKASNNSPTASFGLTNLASTTSTAVTSSANPAAFGQNVTFTATVTASAGTATGSVQFKVDGSNFGTPQSLNASGVATLTTSALTAGTHTIAADYGGDGGFQGSSGSLAVPQVVNPSLSINDVSITEGNSGTVNANFTVTLSAASNQTVTVSFATADGTAHTIPAPPGITPPGSDYFSKVGTLTFAPLETTKPISVAVIGDQTFESNETFFVNLSSPTNATISDSQGTGTITNDDAAGGTIDFASPTFTVTELAGSILVSVNRSGDTTQPVTVDYATSDITTDERKDYTPTRGTLQFDAGIGIRAIEVLINVDAFNEGSELVLLTLSNATGGAALGAQVTTTLQIDNSFWTPPPANSIDDPERFVRQHYHDFLNRDASNDPDGLAFWTNQITECQQPGATCNAELRRINVSAAFFLSIEFQETGYLVERLYKSAYGDATGTSNFGPPHQLPVPVIRFNEFLPDTQRISKDVIVGRTGWEQVLESNKVAFILDFVSRLRFTTAYPTTMTPAEFVDTLYLHAGVTPSAAERTSVIGEFGGAGTSADTGARARVLRRVAENSTLVQQEKNRAFVLIQYFGYLRRDPNDLPDSDYSGYDFWLTKLNEFNGNFVNAEMVKAFIVSGEYRHRFGP